MDMNRVTNSNWEFDLITNYTTDAIFIVDKYDKISFCTPSMSDLTGYSFDELTRMELFEFVHPEDQEMMRSRYNNVQMTLQRSKTEYRIIHKNGSIRYFECKTTPIPGTEDILCVVSVRDITDRKIMEIELERRKNRYEQLQDSLKHFSQDLSSVMKISDLKTRLLQELLTILPSSDPEIFIYNWENTKIEGDRFKELEPYLQDLNVGKLENVLDKVLIKIGIRNDSAYVVVLNAHSIQETMEKIWLETLAYYAVMVFERLNVIENLMNQLESTLQSNEKPQWVLRLLFNLAEKQRMDLSSDLHDTVLQDQIDLYRRLESLINRNEFEKELKDQLIGIEQGLLDTIHQIRMTCNELRPPLLRELGLSRALENLFDHTQLSSTYRIRFITDNSDTISLNEEQTIGIYRIVQELLNNATKHSKASELHFHLTKQEDRLQLVYKDDGVGMELDKLNPSFHNMGLSSMRQRVESLNGKIEFFSQKGSGLRVEIEIPVKGIWA
jgi:two-component system sensor histidine kinase ComP